MMKKKPKSPERLVQTHLTEEARKAVQQLAEREADGSVARWLRQLVMRELGARNMRSVSKSRQLKARLINRKEVDFHFHSPLEEQTFKDMEILADLDGASKIGWVRSLIIERIKREKPRLEAVKRANGVPNGKEICRSPT
jgi:hypothetical protein